MLIMLAVGIPLYICATASTPIAAALQSPPPRYPPPPPPIPSPSSSPLSSSPVTKIPSKPGTFSFDARHASLI